MSLSVNVITLIPHTAAIDDKYRTQAVTDACVFLILNAVREEKEQFDIKINECYALLGM